MGLNPYQPPSRPNSLGSRVESTESPKSVARQRRPLLAWTCLGISLIVTWVFVFWFHEFFIAVQFGRDLTESLVGVSLSAIFIGAFLLMWLGLSRGRTQPTRWGVAVFVSAVGLQMLANLFFP